MGHTDLLTPLSTGAGIALIVPHIIEWLKKSKYVGWITPATDLLSRLLSLGVAAATTAGITFSFDANAGQAVITGLTFSGVVAFLFQLFSQYKAQEFVYRAAIKPFQKDGAQ